MKTWMCEKCGQRYDDPGDCRSCEDEPLLDLGNEDVRLMLQEQDEQRARSRHYAMVMVPSVIGMFAGLALVMVLGSDSRRGNGVIFGGPVMLGAGVGEVLYRIFPPRKALPEGF